MKPFSRDEKRNWDYFECAHCGFVMRDPESFLDPIAEKARYETHNNSIENQGYVGFLSPVVERAMAYLDRGSEGLDYGSGPGPILDQLFQRKGVFVQNYDPFFSPGTDLESGSFDFVSCTEVFEHFYHPARELDRMLSLIKPQGFLFLMTQFRQEKEHFKNWGYRMDNTHVGFLNKKSLGVLCEKWGLQCLESDERISVLKRRM